jgi:hypothetical protein
VGRQKEIDIPASSAHTLPKTVTRNVLELGFLVDSFIHAATPSSGFGLGCCPGTPFTFSRLFEFLPPLAEARDCQSLFGWARMVSSFQERKDEAGREMKECARSSRSRCGSNEFPLRAHGFVMRTAPPGGRDSGFAKCRMRLVGEGHLRTPHRGSALIVDGRLESSLRSLVEPKGIGEVIS